MQNRSPLAVVLLSWVTLGIYSIVWYVKTKEELNELGASIPTAWLLIVPFANWYWLWRYSEAVEELTDGNTSTLGTFILHILFGGIGQAITQSAFNNVRLDDGDDIRIAIETA